MNDSADDAFDRGAYAEAVRLLRERHAVAPPDMVSLSNLDQAERWDAVSDRQRTAARWPESEQAVASLVRALFKTGRLREAQVVIDQTWSKMPTDNPLRRNALTLLVAIRLGMQERALEVVRAWPHPPGGDHGALTVCAHLCGEVMAHRTRRGMPVFVEVLRLLTEQWQLTGEVARFLEGYRQAAGCWLAVPKPPRADRIP